MAKQIGSSGSSPLTGDGHSLNTIDYYLGCHSYLGMLGEEEGGEEESHRGFKYPSSLSRWI